MQTESILDKLNPNDSDSRRRWSITIGAILITRCSMEVIHTMAAGGESHFISTAGPILMGHQFKKEDYRRIFKMVSNCSRLNRRPTEQELKDALGS